MKEIELLFINPVTITALVMQTVNYLKPLLKLDSKYNQVLSWFIAILFCTFGYISKLGMFESISISTFIFFSAMVGLSANGVYVFTQNIKK